MPAFCPGSRARCSHVDLTCLWQSGLVTTSGSRSVLLCVCLCLCLPAGGAAQGVAAPPAAATESAEPLTLAAALALARSRAPAVKAAGERATAQGRAAEATRAWRQPTLDVSIENLGPRDLQHDAFVWLTQPLDIGARRSTRIAAARATHESLARAVDVHRQDLDAVVIETYIAMVRNREAMGLLAAHERAVEDVVALTRRRVAEGVAPEGDLRKLEAERARIALAGARAEIALRQDALTLGMLTGEPALPLVDRVTPPPPLPIGMPDVEAAVERRPDVRAAVAHLAERRSAAALERALGGTAVALTGGYKRTEGFHTGTAGIAIDLPIGVRNKPALLRAEGDVTAATLELEQARAAARADIERALVAGRLLSEQAARVEHDLVQPAAVAQRAARAAFREGTGDALALVDADRVYLDTRREALDLQLDASAASLRARLALGEDPLP